MRKDFKSQIQSETCNYYIELVQKCYEDHPLGRFFGNCTSEFRQMTKCLKEERLVRRQKSYEKSLETKAKLRQLFKEEREREKAETTNG